MRILAIILSLAWVLTVPVSAMDFTAPAAPEQAQKYLPDETEDFGEGLRFVIKSALETVQPSIMEALGVCVSLVIAAMLVGLISEIPGNVKTNVELVGTVTAGVLLFRPANSLIRLGIDIIETAELNATKPREDLKGSADAVICDVPCSGLGIIAKKPDIKYKNLSDIERLPEIQLSILTASSEYLKKGGRLMYSTCTLNPEENEKITDEFLKTHKGFHRAEGFPRTAFPTDVWEDGFFCDLIIKD